MDKILRGVRLREFKLRTIILGVRMHFRHTKAGHMKISGVTSYGARAPLELVQVVIFTLHVCSVAFRCSQKRS